MCLSLEIACCQKPLLSLEILIYGTCEGEKFAGALLFY